jgi:arylformamidase
MRTYDISLTISPNLPIWPGDTPISIERTEKIEQGSDANVTRLEMSAHVGTHVDAPYHFLGGEAATVEQLPLNILYGRAYVLQIEDEVDLITKSVLKNAAIPLRIRRLLLKTRNSLYWAGGETKFQEEFVALSEDGAQYLVDRGIRLIGIDYLSVAPFSDTGPTHKVLLSAGVVILEGLNLSFVSPGRYTLYCLPIKIKGADGAPARAILIGS